MMAADLPINLAINQIIHLTKKIIIIIYRIAKIIVINEDLPLLKMSYRMSIQIIKVNFNNKKKINIIDFFLIFLFFFFFYFYFIFI
jgi:hypothetical protein